VVGRCCAGGWTRSSRAGAENQAMLVETVTAIQTVKASALEPAIARRWDKQLAAYVSAGFRTQSLATWAHEGVNLIGKLVNAATLWYGAHLVMDNQLTVGQFVAFTCLRSGWPSPSCAWPSCGRISSRPASRWRGWATS
jgi:ABC-type bacteriocin/lantibiotic exporter with double-glycine peptidase domain